MKNLKLLFLIFLLSVAHTSYSQTNESISKVYQFSGAITVTKNGISLIPTFSLGKPAAIFEMSVGKKLTFDPQFRASLDGKPWSVILWMRYKLLRTKKFSLNIGAHPSLVFKNTTNTINGVTTASIETTRYVASEIVPNYYISKNTTIGFYYLISFGLGNGAIGKTHFLTVNSNFTNIRLSEKFYMKFNPQFYYLKMDTNQGYYFSSSLTLLKKDFPFSVSTIINKTIKSDILGSKDFVWNINLTYRFANNYKKYKL